MVCAKKRRSWANVQLPHAVLVERVALLVAIESENRDFIFFLELEVIRHANLLEKRPAIP
jgi:hypothetical protein